MSLRGLWRLSDFARRKGGATEAVICPRRLRVPAEHAPYEVFTAKKEWELTVVRAEEHDGPLKEFYPVWGQDMSKEGDSRIPMWKIVEDGERLPYGEVIPNYLLAKDISENITKRRRIPPFSRP